MKTAFITGALGMDGANLSKYLLNLGYHVVGIARRHSSDAESWRDLELLKDEPRFELYWGDICDQGFMTELICRYFPDEFYSYAAQSHVAYSFANPLETIEVSGLAVIKILEILRRHSCDTKFLQASTSELYGGLNCPLEGYNENSRFHPRSPYACAKALSHYSTINYREAFGVFACASILFNHTGTNRGLDFFERKVTKTIAEIKLGLKKEIILGNLESFRDLGASKDYIVAQHKMLQQEKPDEYVVATGQTHQVREILETVARIADIKNIYDYVVYDKNLLRPSEVPYLLGDSSKARKELDWKPTYTFDTLLEEMYKNDYNLLKE